MMAQTILVNAQVIEVMQQAQGRDLSAFDAAFLAKSLERRLANSAEAAAAAYIGYLQISWPLAHQALSPGQAD